MLPRTSPVFEVTAPFGPLGTPPVMQKDHDVENESSGAATIHQLGRRHAVSRTRRRAWPKRVRRSCAKPSIARRSHRHGHARAHGSPSRDPWISRRKDHPERLVPGPRRAAARARGGRRWRSRVQAHSPRHRLLEVLELALTQALALAQEADARLTLLHAIEFPQALHDVPLPREPRSIVFTPLPKPSICGACARSCRLRRGCTARWRRG